MSFHTRHKSWHHTDLIVCESHAAHLLATFDQARDAAGQQARWSRAEISCKQLFCILEHVSGTLIHKSTSSSSDEKC